MNNKLVSVVGIIAVLGVILGFAGVNKHVPVSEPVVGAVGQQGPKGDRGPQGPMGPQGVRGPSGQDSQIRLGSVSGPDNNNFPYWGVNGVNTFFKRIPMASASSTACAMQGPGATSTLMFASINVASSSAQASVWVIATSTNQYATTTALLTTTLAANIVGAAAWYPSIQAQNSAMGAATSTGILPPNAWVVISNSAITGGFPGGTCEMEAVQL